MTFLLAEVNGQFFYNDDVLIVVAGSLYGELSWCSHKKTTAQMSLSTARILKHTLSLIPSVEYKNLQRHMAHFNIAFIHCGLFKHRRCAKQKISRQAADLCAPGSVGNARARLPTVCF
jgi:hypothetical protein